jgi:hypothetical protein
MTILVTAHGEMNIGEANTLESTAPDGVLAAVFEDDGETGYFYAIHESAEGNPLRDALHIYNVEDIADRHKPCNVKVGWSEDNKKCVLLINGYPHGVFDFQNKNGYCRTGFPVAVNAEWSVAGHEWDDKVDEFFR